jgi:predicted Zn-dependent peptidase
MTIRTATLPNGFRIIHETPNSKTPLTSFQVFCNVGSIHEPDDLRGVSHFIEHMCFKGTKKVPQSKDIFYVYDNVGAYFNASTNKHYTNYMVKCEDEYVNHCVDILSDMLLNSTFPHSEFKKEEDVVIEENLKNEDDPENELAEEAEKLIYADTPFRHPIDTLAYHRGRRFDSRKVIAFYRQYYHPEQMILSIVSNIPFDTIVRMIKHTYFSKKRGKCEVSQQLEPSNLSVQVPTNGEIQYFRKEKKSLKSSHLSISFKVCNQYSKDKYTLRFLQNVLSGSLSSRLFSILREKNGLTYRSDINLSFYEVMGDFTIYAQLDCAKLMKNGAKKSGVLPLIIDLLNDIIRNGITAEELFMFKHNLRGKMVLNQEDLDTQTEYNGIEYLLYNTPDKIVPYADLYDTHYKSVTLKKIHDCIRTYFKKERMVVSLIGCDLPELKKIQEACENLSQ